MDWFVGVSVSIQIIRAIEARAEEEERGIYRPDNVASVAGVNKHEGGGRNSCGGGGDDGGWAKEICCEKHASQLERSAVHRREERVRETSSKVCVFLLRLTLDRKAHYERMNLWLSDK